MEPNLYDYEYDYASDYDEAEESEVEDLLSNEEWLNEIDLFSSKDDDQRMMKAINLIAGDDFQDGAALIYEVINDQAIEEARRILERKKQDGDYY